MPSTSGVKFRFSSHCVDTLAKEHCEAEEAQEQTTERIHHLSYNTKLEKTGFRWPEFYSVTEKDGKHLNLKIWQAEY